MEHVLSSEGLFPKPEKVDSILNKKHLQVKVTLVVFWLLLLTVAQRQLTPQKGIDFVWNEQRE